jgi:hypothetical protein
MSVEFYVADPHKYVSSKAVGGVYAEIAEKQRKNKTR